MINNDNIRIRRAEYGDREFWFSLDKHLAESEFNKKVRDRQGYVLLADGKPAGILRYNLFWDNTPFCNLLYIKEEFQRKGFGKRLMSYWENRMRAEGYRWLLVSTQSDERAQYFYRALGYCDCGSLLAPDQPPELFLSKYVQAISYLKLGGQNFNAFSLDNFIRRQEVYKCWRKMDGEYKLTPVRYTEDWDLSERRQLAQRILNAVNNGSPAYGAFEGGEVAGFALLDKELFGSTKQYIDLAEFYVSASYRGLGIGAKLFNAACAGAKELGAKKLYISAHSAEDSIGAYYSYGCVSAKEINKSLQEKEPCDLQLEYVLE